MPWFCICLRFVPWLCSLKSVQVWESRLSARNRPLWEEFYMKKMIAESMKFYGKLKKDKNKNKMQWKTQELDWSHMTNLRLKVALITWLSTCIYNVRQRNEIVSLAEIKTFFLFIMCSFIKFDVEICKVGYADSFLDIISNFEFVWQD